VQVPKQLSNLFEMDGFYNVNYSFVYQFYSGFLFVNFACFVMEFACRGVLFSTMPLQESTEQCTFKSLFLNSNLLATIMFSKYRGPGNAGLSLYS